MLVKGGKIKKVPMNYQRLGAILIAIGVNADTSNQLINTNTQGAISCNLYVSTKPNDSTVKSKQSSDYN